MKIMNCENLLHNSIENCLDSYCIDSETERIKYQQNENMICLTLDRAVNKMTSHGKHKQNPAQ